MTAIHRVLCPIDLSDASCHALDHAAAIARQYKSSLTLLSVFVTSSVIDAPARHLDTRERERLTTALQQLAARVPSEVTTNVAVVEGSEIHDTITATVAEGQFELLVMGTHGRSGFRRLVIGSVTERVLRTPPCATLVVPPRASAPPSSAPWHFRHIVCAVDFSTGSSATLAFALSLAQEADAELLVLNVIEVVPESLGTAVPPADVDDIRATTESDRLRRLRAMIPAAARKFCTVETAVLEGAPGHGILEACEARRADLLVLGISHHGMLDCLLFGGTAARVSRAAPCPVLLVPEPVRSSGST